MKPNTKLKVTKRSNGSNRVVLTKFGKSRTQQHTKDHVDINNIMKKFQKTGRLPEGKVNPMYDDFSQVEDYHTSLNTIFKADDQFSSLSSDIRKKFQNDPAQFLQFVNDPKNKEEMIKLGLMENPDPYVYITEAERQANIERDKPNHKQNIDAAEKAAQEPKT